ncbi:P-loop containing nucleoside triphosphate hydrolase protein [Xylariales sp. PMI_506]|nr:P-loop containing nucleoside triphosphate hydrolase protein [Xylariales sp. PMI_506]
MRSVFRTRWATPSLLSHTRCCTHGFSTTSIARDSQDSPPVRGPVIQKVETRSSPAAIAARQQASKTYTTFRKLVLSRIDAFAGSKGDWTQRKDEYISFGVKSQIEYDREMSLFRRSVDSACERAIRRNTITRTENPLFFKLRDAFVSGDVPGLGQEIKFSFHNFLMRSRFSKVITATHRKIADMRFPFDWFPATRAMQRTIHLHVGPTNSGKTYNALKALENAKSGIYAGPLRLLAHEVYTRFIAQGKPCALITGEEQRIPEEDTYFRSCTVEMAPLNYSIDVAVIDEIQMIGDKDRGWAWTQAVLGVQAKEVHLCGEERAVDLIQALCHYTGDKCIVHRYERLSPLAPMNKSLRGNLQNLEKGDAIVSFSRIGIHSLKRAVESTTGKRCAIVYGSLPPETRAQQAALFNDPDNDYDFLVASDAIGMGLNLEIKRVIFEATHKRNRAGYHKLTTSDLRQIGGRAGRYRTAAQATREAAAARNNAENRQIGLVTAMEEEDLKNIHQAFKREPEPIKTAGLQVPPSVVERFSTYFPPSTPLSYILLRLRDIARLSPRFHLCDTAEMIDIADLIQPYPMPIFDRAIFLNAPVFLREKGGVEVLQAFARCVSSMDGGRLLDIPEIDLELLDEKDNPFEDAGERLRRFEVLHKTITLYLWLSYRYSGVFSSQALAFHVKGLVEAQISRLLDALNISDESRRARQMQIRKKVQATARKKQRVLGQVLPDQQPDSEGPGEWNEEGHGEPLYEDPGELNDISRVDEKKQRARV